MNKYRIGYLDDDEGQNLTFYGMFKDEFTVTNIEIDNVSSPPDIVSEIVKNNLELIVLDFRLDSGGKSFNADELLKEIKKWNPYFPVLILTSHELNAFHQLDDVNIINSKNVFEQMNKESKLFIVKIEEIIKKYNYKKEFALKKLEELVEKKGEIGLSLEEEEEYYMFYRFLNDSSPSERILPSNILRPEAISSLHELLVSTKDILSHLKGEK
jgi:DNA-binding NtrC family response regulator